MCRECKDGATDLRGVPSAFDSNNNERRERVWTDPSDLLPYSLDPVLLLARCELLSLRTEAEDEVAFPCGEAEEDGE